MTIKAFALSFLVALALGGCATVSSSGTNDGPVQVVLNKSNTTGTHVAVMLPLGNEAFDSGGMDHIAALAAQLPGVTRVQIYDYYQTVAAAGGISADPATVKEVVIGFSCGANASPIVAAGANHKVDGVFVIQVSEWCGGTPLTGNVVRAQETYNPNCFDTGGLGCGKLVPGPDFDPSNLTFIERPDCHTCSDHDPDAINDIISAIRTVTSVNANRRMAAALGHRKGKPRVLVRYHGQTPY
jgi:hypothetical protein